MHCVSLASALSVICLHGYIVNMPMNMLGTIEIVDFVPTKTKRIPLHDGLIRSYPPRGSGAPNYWSDMLNEGENLNKELRGQDKATYLDIIEVGANDVIQA